MKFRPLMASPLSAALALLATTFSLPLFAQSPSAPLPATGTPAPAEVAPAEKTSTGQPEGVSTVAPAPVSVVAPAVVEEKNDKKTEGAEPKKEDEIVVSAKFGKGITVGTADEKFTVNIRARAQVQALVSDEDGPGGEVTQFQVRRMRLLLQGNVWGKDLTYYFQLGFSNRDTEPDVRLPLRDAYVTYAGVRDLNVRFGQMKVPYGRQRVTSSSALGMVDRSLVVTELNLDRDVGVQLLSKDLFGLGEKFAYNLGVFGGDGRNRLATNAGYLFVARVNFSPFGGFDDNVEADVKREKKVRLAIGFGGAYNQATNRPHSTTGLPYVDPSVNFTYGHLGADFMFKYAGFFAIGEWMLRAADPETRVGVDAAGAPTTYVARQAWGAYGQLGQMLTDSLEVTARYGHVNPIGGASEVGLLNEVGGGLSYYFDHHNWKIQGDYFYLSGNSDFSAGTNQGRVQAQLYF